MGDEDAASRADEALGDALVLDDLRAECVVAADGVIGLAPDEYELAVGDDVARPLCAVDALEIDEAE